MITYLRDKLIIVHYPGSLGHKQHSKSILKMEFSLIYGISCMTVMLSTESVISEGCKHIWEEVSYDETANHVRHVSYVLVSGGKVMGSTKTFICSRCALIHEYIVPI